MGAMHVADVKARGGGARQPVTQERVLLLLDILRPIAAGCRDLRALGLVHGDLKPGNVAFQGEPHNWELKITDFDLSFKCLEGEERTFNGYTEGYAAPEILQPMQRLAGPKADVYSFGVLMWELAHGSAPGQLGTKRRHHTHTQCAPTTLATTASLSARCLQAMFSAQRSGSISAALPEHAWLQASSA